MPTSSKIQREDIIKVAFEILKESGIEKVNARDIAKKLNCSIRPVYYQFNTMEDLRKELLNYTLDYYNNFLLDIKGNGPKYKEIGFNYIRFAKEEPNIFKFIFMGNYEIKIEEFAYFDKGYEEVEKILQIQNELSREIAKNFHLKMWLYTHGIACLIATNTASFTDKELSSLLTEQFQALLNSFIQDNKKKIPKVGGKNND